MIENLKSKIIKRKTDTFFKNDITFRSNRGRQPELNKDEAEGDEPEIYYVDGEVDVLDDDTAEVEMIDVKKKGNNK